MKYLKEEGKGNFNIHWIGGVDYNIYFSNIIDDEKPAFLIKN